MRTSTISKIEIIDKIYEETVKSELKNEILLQLRHRFFTEKKENKHLEEILQSFNDEIFIIIYNNNIDNVSNNSNGNISDNKMEISNNTSTLGKGKSNTLERKSQRKIRHRKEISKNGSDNCNM